jgi:tetratricopeptide (TPR) repeat protein
LICIGKESPTVMSDSSCSMESIWTKLSPWLIVVVGVMAYVNTFGNPFIFDDAYVASMRLELIRNFLEWFNPRSLVNLTFYFNHLLDGKNPAGFHAVNLVIHILAALLLYGLVRRTLALRLDVGWTPAMACGMATVSALLWMIHPLQTESVTYICQRYESLMGLMFLLTLYGFVRAADSDRPVPWLIVSAASCWLGMETKEVMVVAPLLVGVYDYCFVSKGWGGVIRRWPFYSVLGMSWGFLFVLHHHAVTAATKWGYAVTYPSVAPWIYLRTQAAVIVHYLRLASWPTGLCLDYAWAPAESLQVVWAPMAFIMILIVLTVVGLWRRKPISYLGACFFLILAPSSSVVPLHDMAFEHRMYLPLAAIIVLGVVGGTRLLLLFFGSERRNRILLLGGGVLALGILTVLTAMTIRRNQTYASEETMWRDVVRKSPHNLRAQVALAVLLNQQGRFAESGPLTQDLVCRLRVVRQSGNRSRYPTAATDPNVLYPEALQQWGISLLGMGRAQQAADCFREALGLMPTRRLHHNLSLALVQSGRMEDALREIDAAITLDPENALSWAFKAELLARTGRFAESVQAYERALECDSTCAAFRLDFAWLLATCRDARVRDGDRALKLSESALTSVGARSARGLDVLAAAYAETGRFKEAVKSVREALEIEVAQHSGQTISPYAAGLKERLIGYQNGQPYRDTRHMASD